MSTWPDLSIDIQAFELAACALGPDASVSDLAQRAQQIKDAIKRGEIIVSREKFASFLTCLEVESETERERRLNQ